MAFVITPNTKRKDLIKLPQILHFNTGFFPATLFLPQPQGIQHIL